MNSIIDSIIDAIDGLLGWVGASFGQWAENYCKIESAEDTYNLVARDGSLVSIIKIDGATYLVGPDEFEKIHKELTTSLKAALSRDGHGLQMFFKYDSENIVKQLNSIISPAKETAVRLGLNLEDLFNEKINFLKTYCHEEEMYFVLWTMPSSMSQAQTDQANKNRTDKFKGTKIPLMINAQNFLSSIPEIRESHNSFVTLTLNTLNDIGFACERLNVHDACLAIRKNIDPDFTDDSWQPYLPGDNIPVRETKNFYGTVSDLLWPPLYKQLIPRDVKIVDLKVANIGDRIYGSVFIDLFPKELTAFITLLNRLENYSLPWRISFWVESGGIQSLSLKSTIASLLSFASDNNKLINKSIDYLKYLSTNTDEAIVKLKVTATTWAAVNEEPLLRRRLSELAKAIQSWGYTETSEISGDAFASVLSSALSITNDIVATTSVAPLSHVTYMFPLTRPSSPWRNGAILFRSMDGKPWPYQPGSTLQTTWIDLIYARPGSGKSILSNAINLALCLSAGITRLPRISIIDIGPSSSGLISLLKEALPKNQQHLVAYHRLRMVKEMSINPFDTQLGCRYPSPQERAFLVNFLTLLATPIGETKSYDGIADMVGLVIDEMYKKFADTGNPNLYTANLDTTIDKKLQELNFKNDQHCTWWEVTDFLFKNQEVHLAHIAQRYATPLLADAASICRTSNIEDLYGKIITPTGENIIAAFGRMISSAIREYPILSSITSFDLGESRIVSLDLDEVAKSGGEAADRQTAVMYMLARYILARNYYLIDEHVKNMPALYQEHHSKIIKEIREDPKRIVFDEFHRTSKAKAVREQVIIDMREGRKWKVQVALLSQSLDDFDPVMVEFATGIFIMDAGPKQAIDKSAKVFGLSETAKLALERKVHGPRQEGSTFLAQFATKNGVNTQLITNTIGPIELWAFSTTAEDVRIRNALYDQIGAANTRTLLAKLYPTGSAAKEIEKRLATFKDANANQMELITKEQTNSLIEQLINEILSIYRKSNPV
jgi:intracellular multiplication protein IcmB